MRLTEALNVIKDECRGHKRCLDCPLSSRDGINCMVMKEIPKRWVVK